MYPIILASGCFIFNYSSLWIGTFRVHQLNEHTIQAHLILFVKLFL
eukprot:UN01840